jgi:hypothetical protein
VLLLTVLEIMLDKAAELQMDALIKAIQNKLLLSIYGL